MRRLEDAAAGERQGDAGHAKEPRWWVITSDLLRDLRFGWRGLGRSPGFTLVATATIAIGVGATTAVLTVADALLLRPLPVVEPDRLAAIWESRTGAVVGSWERSMVPYERYEAFAEATADVFTSLAAHRYETLTLRAGERAEAIVANLTSSNYFQVLGLRPAAGRFYSDDSQPAVVLSHSFWRARFGGDSAAIGRIVHVDSRPFLVAGIAPEGFSGTTTVRPPVDLWVPVIEYHPVADLSGLGWVLPFGRLRQGIDRARAQERIADVVQQIPPNESHTRVTGAWLDPLAWNGDELAEVTRFIGTLLATGLLVFLIASANVAGMLIARATGRRREVAVRLAIGAGQARLARQLLVDNLLLFLIGGLGGWMIAMWAMPLLPRLFGQAIPLDLTPDLGLLVVALALAASIGFVFGLGPALRTTRLDLTTTLKEGVTVTGGRTGRRRSVFVVAQVALTAMLLVIAGLFVRTLRQGQAVDLGFEPADVVVAATDVEPHGYDPERARVFYGQLVERVRRAPGVESAALANVVPLGGGLLLNNAHAADTAASGPAMTNAGWNVVDTAYFGMMRIEFVAGRAFTAEDHAGGPPVVIVNETLARRLWPGESAIGKRLREGRNIYEVIGVTRDGKYASVTEDPRAFAFLPFAQAHRSAMALHVRTQPGATGLLDAIQQEVRGLDGNIAVSNARPLASIMEASLAPERLAATLTALFGLIGIVLAAIGIYGVLGMYVAQRGREFGIRIALGARRRDVLRSVVARGAVLAAAGAAIGLALASAVTRFVRSFLFGVSPLDPATFATVAALLIAAALIASYVPARRATTADPLAVLRQQ